MRERTRVPRAPIGWAGLLTFALLATGVPVAAQQADHPGKPVYDKWCAGCHGVDGDGRGEAAEWMLPRPRDFTVGIYQIRTTASGQLPTDADILRVIDDGMPGTTMPGWRTKLSRGDRNNLVDYLKTFSRFFETEPEPEPVRVGRAPRASDEAIAEGREIYQRIECWKCHGDAGRGDGESAPTQSDDGGFPVRPADLTQPWLFNGGASTQDIYTRLVTGLDGTPMPSFADLVDADIVTEDQLWNLALYVRSLAPDGHRGRDVVRAALVDAGAMPAGVADEDWDGIDAYYIPLVGQIVVEPRTFAPAIHGVWVQAAHDGTELALRVSWTDPSRSPDPLWEEWRQAVVRVMEPREGDHSAGQPPDALTVQVPATMPTGRALPFFLGGDDRMPVNLWRWRSDRQGIEEAIGRGLDEVEPMTGGGMRALADFRDGRWTLVVRRALDSDDPERRLAMPRGEAIPIAFFAQDGSSGEEGHRGSISSWYYLYLDQPVAASVYVTPVVATVLTALLLLGIVTRARRAERTEAPATETLYQGSTT